MNESILRAAADKARAGQQTPRIAAVMPPLERPKLQLASAVESEDDAAERRRRARQVDVDRLLRSACIPARYEHASIDNLDRVPVDTRKRYGAVLDKLLELSKRPGAIIALVGTRGPGKTHMSCALVNHACRNLQPARYAVKSRYFDAIKHEFRPGGDESNVERQHREPALLVLDEIQIQAETKWQQDRFTDLVDYRYGENRVTVLISNVSADELPALVGDSVYDRIFDCGGLLECKWASLRGRITH